MAQSLAELLRDLRAQRALSLVQLAARAEIAERTLRYWESGTYQPRLPELEMVLGALEASSVQRTQALTLIAAPRSTRQMRQSPEHLRQEKAVGALPSGGDLLRALRQRRGLQTEQIAALMGVSKATVSRWENGAVVPPSDRLDTLLKLLGAREGERAALKEGYLFLAMPLREIAIAPSELQERFEAFSLSLYANREDKLNDLRFLSFETQAWQLAAKDAGGRRLLASVCANYADFLSGFHRMEEAGRYAHRALELMARQNGSQETRLRAAVIAATAEVYRGARPAPRRGLKMLQSWRSSADLPEFEAWMLSDMAEYLMLESDWETAVRLCREACRIAERSKNPYEFRLRQLDLAKAEVAAGHAEHGLSLVSFDPQTTPFRRADIELLFAEGLAALEERKDALTWLERANTDIQAYDLTHLHDRANALMKRF